jgi:alkylation response protein AidB-like acyl-CoA dehydrogenase
MRIAIVRGLLRFQHTPLSDGELALQADVREFLARELPPGSFTPGLGMASPRDPEFSRKLARRGWLGMALPREYGGGARTAAERFIVVEELLRWGAPVGYHWVADRQSGPMIARFGSAEQKERFLPAICRGEVSFSIGMSEPDAGSDLAAVQTRGERVDGGWSLTGTKIWTGGAHVNDWFVVLCRTSDGEDKHAGLSQLIVDLRSPGLTAEPIPYLDGSEFFCRVTLEQVFVPDELVLGEIGSGWTQNTSELAFERAGPERWLSSYLLVEEWVRERGESFDDAALETLGQALAMWWALRALSLSVARLIDAGEAPAAESALVKELGTRFEQDVLDAVWRLAELGPRTGGESAFEQLLARAVLAAPSYTIRGGTNEILRTVAARALRP